ncbi:hypothetical protein AMTR_s00068p00126380 [Amborella trichopoda]|uniref:Uncharacterized protein n=1 Tax=Amborella trichopoda TaxID=13333 RepID=U5DE01_AMBTC|nr:hypothetical protein AMTR_s00068p00126380 [Amborella trichopoda]
MSTNNSMEEDVRKSKQLKAALLGVYAACVVVVESITRPIPFRVWPTRKDQKRKMTLDEIFDEKLSKIAEAIKSLGNDRDEQVFNDVFEAMMKMGFLDSKMQLIVYDNLSDDLRKCKTFLTMNDQKREEWVRMKYGNFNNHFK